LTKIIKGGRIIDPASSGWIGLGTSGGKGAADLREDDADLRGNARHDRASGNGDEAGHQCVLNEVLSARLFLHSEVPDEIGNFFHFMISPLTLCVGKTKLTRYRFFINSE